MEKIVTLKFFRGRKGNLIAKLPSGKVALINRNAINTPEENEYWVCRIDFEKQRFVVVTPLRKPKRVYVYKCGHSSIHDSDKDEIIRCDYVCIDCQMEQWKVENLKAVPEAKRKLKHYADVLSTIPDPPEPTRITWHTVEERICELDDYDDDDGYIIEVYRGTTYELEWGECPLFGEATVPVHTWFAVYRRIINHTEVTNKKELEEWFSKLSTEQKKAIIFCYEWGTEWKDSLNEHAIAIKNETVMDGLTQSMISLDDDVLNLTALSAVNMLRKLRSN